MPVLLNQTLILWKVKNKKTGAIRTQLDHGACLLSVTFSFWNYIGQWKFSSICTVNINIAWENLHGFSKAWSSFPFPIVISNKESKHLRAIEVSCEIHSSHQALIYYVNYKSIFFFFFWIERVSFCAFIKNHVVQGGITIKGFQTVL